MAKRNARTAQLTAKTQHLNSQQAKKLLEQGRRLGAKVHREMKPLFRLTESVIKLRFR